MQIVCNQNINTIPISSYKLMTLWRRKYFDCILRWLFNRQPTGTANKELINLSYSIIQMDSYRSRSISQLVSQLNNLGQENVLLEPARLLALHQCDLPGLTRLKSTNGQQFFVESSHPDKKYAYNQIAASLGQQQLQPIRELFQRGFNVTLMFTQPKDQPPLMQLLSLLMLWVYPRDNTTNLICGLQFAEGAVTQVIGGSKITERDLNNRLRYFRIPKGSFMHVADRIVRGLQDTIRIIKFRSFSDNKISSNCLSLLILPPAFHSESKRSNKDYLTTVKSQLTQIFNYIKLNPNQRYQHFSKLLTKRLPATNAIAELILQDSASMVLNWVGEGTPAERKQRLVFYDRIGGISPLLRRDNQEQASVQSLELPESYSQDNNQKTTARGRQGKGSLQKIDKLVRTERTPINQLTEQCYNELQYCRSLERKTHRFSLNEGQLFSDGSVQGLPDYDKHKQDSMQVNPKGSQVAEALPFPKLPSRQMEKTLPRNVASDQSQQLALLRSAHAVEVSQYHQTIQNLNRKIQILMQEGNLTELYTLHERQLMVLQLKIKELREDISNLSSNPNDKTFKSMVRKLNDQVKLLENNNAEQKVSRARLIQLERQLQEWKKKYQDSESFRKKLTTELEHLTKRLQICDAEIKHLSTLDLKQEKGMEKGLQLPSTGKLSLADQQSLRQISILIIGIREGQGQSEHFLLRKISSILQDLSRARQTILECNDFLIQLQQHLQDRLGSREPQTVLDCNKFIRNFLMDNLSIF